jgi:hypothetical protein
MIEHINIIKIKNGWVITIISKGIIIDNVCKWLKENINSE